MREVDVLEAPEKQFMASERPKRQFVSEVGEMLITSVRGGQCTLVVIAGAERTIDVRARHRSALIRRVY